MLLSASFGSGHSQAARALKEALVTAGIENCTEADYLKFVPAWERGPVTWTYAFWLRYWPGAYRWFYQWSNRPSEPKLITEAFGRAGLGNIRKMLLEADPDAIIASYATVIAVISRARAAEGLNFTNALVVTDLRAHRHWARPEADLIFAANEETKADLVGHGVDPEKVHVTGIPIMPAYRNLSPKEELRRKHGFDERPVVLLSSGGTGSYRSYRVVLNLLLDSGLPMQVVTFDRQDSEYRIEDRGPVRWFRPGYRQDYPEWLGAADLVVGKAGGLTASESLAVGVPMLIYDPIPGQEEGNAEYLERHGAAIWARKMSDLESALKRLLRDEALRQEMGQRARALGRPDSAEAVVRILLREVGR
ncbi:MGDG synthase family glycosyltransferase [Oceanithermus sp.]